MTAFRQLREPHSTLLEFKNMKFLILDQPEDFFMDKFIEECLYHNTVALVRVCECDYDTKILQEKGIRVLDWYFEDGSPPPEDIIDNWCSLLKEVFLENSSEEEVTVAIHCRAGLGRAPVLVAVALIELGLPFDNAIELIRQKRQGSFNTKQINFLRDYRPQRRLKTRQSVTSRMSELAETKCCLS